ncbi:hypothetical protein DFH05DRAFT_1507633 [Lentinula detonsa]|uniref:Uncharacterized protein n=1 Tax=Lentinula detonsa TaxID=2804962 RepID=A0A9W8NUC7_9AGAR|nr:hypothetical protein DFH05DRAFT_1507633 [Lentinula detonsa]
MVYWARGFDRHSVVGWFVCLFTLWKSPGTSYSHSHPHSLSHTLSLSLSLNPFSSFQPLSPSHLQRRQNFINDEVTTCSRPTDDDDERLQRLERLERLEIRKRTCNLLLTLSLCRSARNTPQLQGPGREGICFIMIIIIIIIVTSD